jgi:hypothetical protein
MTTKQSENASDFPFVLLRHSVVLKNDVGIWIRAENISDFLNMDDCRRGMRSGSRSEQNWQGKRDENSIIQPIEQQVAFSSVTTLFFVYERHGDGPRYFKMRHYAANGAI